MTDEHKTQVNRTDDVRETWRDRQMGVKVERVVRSGYETDQKLLKVYRKSTETYRGIESGEPEEVTRWEKIGEFKPQTATEVLFGLAEAHGYDLEAK